jgi:hypothetical protein
MSHAVPHILPKQGLGKREQLGYRRASLDQAEASSA